MNKNIVIEWNHNPRKGEIVVQSGSIVYGEFVKGEAQHGDGRLLFGEGSSFRLELEIEAPNTPMTADKPIVTVHTAIHSFSFFIQDVNMKCPIFIPSYGVVVTEGQDTRSYEQIEKRTKDMELSTSLRKIEREPEESFENAAVMTRSLTAPTWLGLSRDVRIFEVGLRNVDDTEKLWDWIQPRFHGEPTTLPENENKQVRYHYMLGRGIGCEERISRRLDEGIHPILHGRIEEDEMVYETTSFVSLEHQELRPANIKGTPYLVADGYGHGYMLTEEQQAERQRQLAEAINEEEETVLYTRASATNTASVPRYAWFKNPIPNANVLAQSLPYVFDGVSGYAMYTADRIYCVSRLNGEPLANEEMAILLLPGETAVFELFVPHRPISRERADALSGQNFDKRLKQCREYWRGKFSSATQVRLPEKRLEEMIQAGLLQLDLITYGTEPEGTLLPTIGVYTAIGSESAPIIQFMDSFGWGGIAARSLQFFLDKQHDNGFIQNFNGYMLETGTFLWCVGEHYRYNGDDYWISRYKTKLMKAYEYIVEWRERNRTEAFIDRGFGMIDGKTADPEDPFHSFMLNGYAYMGLSRLSEIFKASDPILSSSINEVAEAFKLDIRTAFTSSMIHSPVVPIGNGTWVPTAAPWAEYRGPVSLFAGGGKWLTHGSAVGRDSLLGPLYLVFQEVLQPDEPSVCHMLDYHNELMCSRNVALSQPYYSVHPWIHLKRGEVKPFLKAYYNAVASLADRETYTFWEHYWHASPHKTHEEAWFLMQTRWMLYMEEEETLNLLPGIPRAWLEHGKVIDIQGARSYFGVFSLKVESFLEEGYISARVDCDPLRKPRSINIRLPHPEGIQAMRADIGVYCPEREAVTIDDIAAGSVEFKLYFERQV
ncbi:hypothetical protein M6D81_28885 [Paenibacillus sp. J5C_2022]|uniref:hypothetical protein n=1 Tax=Paenibacillus sp. J5C2022 TaxID=2977129 RepID=UPI0021D06DD7|nr:hypothetical protein [Paenibacillus sp. J5C2022]MCU6712723.1 hypothetical protein [Paenibacillus sp. J5C2022]